MHTDFNRSRISGPVLVIDRLIYNLKLSWHQRRYIHLTELVLDPIEFINRVRIFILPPILQSYLFIKETNLHRVLTIDGTSGLYRRTNHIHYG